MKKAELLIHRISSVFISLFVYLYNIILIVSYISSFYNRLSIVGPLFVIEWRGKPMSDYEIIMLLWQVMTVVIAFGALIALICLGKDK